MNIDPITVLNGCHTTALILVILMTLIVPTFTGAILAAGLLWKMTGLLKIGVRLVRLRPPCATRTRPRRWASFLCRLAWFVTGHQFAQLVVEANALN